MKIHYFQRYHAKENVSTGNTMLLFSRLYHYSPGKFHQFIRDLIGGQFQDFETDIMFEMQVKGVGAVPDGRIKQNSFSIVIETKLGKDFDIGQITNHLKTFVTEDYQVMLTLSPYPIPKQQEAAIGQAIQAENAASNKNIVHVHLSFEEIISRIGDLVDENRDYEFIDILDDYREWCSHEGLLSNRERMMRTVTVGRTLEDNLKYKLYYDPAARGYSEHRYLGLYKDKAVRAIGEIVNIIEADVVNDKVVVYGSTSPMTPEQETHILAAVKSSSVHGWGVEKGHKFFCVNEFIETSFKKDSKYPLQGTKFFDISKLTGKSVESMTTQEIAAQLATMVW